MELEPYVAYRALLARDARFDGRFFVGVSTTGIYCRPICPAKTPGRDRCTFYRSPVEAELAGYRPCLRCRPELAPGLAPMDRPDRLARLAVRRIEGGHLVEGTMGELARDLGVSDRHVRRVIHSVYGVAPIELAMTHRLLVAKQLLTDTLLPIGEVAHASGFRSVRRFNEAFQQRYRMVPGEIRKRASAGDPHGATIHLAYRPPFDGPSLFGYFGSRAIGGIEWGNGSRYARSVRIGDAKGWVSVEDEPEHYRLAVRLSPALLPHLPKLQVRLKRMFDTAADPEPILAVLGSLAAARPGLRVPGSFDPFETVVRVVLGQQVSVSAANTLARRLVENFGEAISTPCEGVTHLFPPPSRLAEADLASVVQLGLTGRRAETLQRVAAAFAEDSQFVHPGLDLAELEARLGPMAGIGPWTIQAVALKVLRWPDAFMASDLGIRKALGIDSATEVERYAERWRPWRAYAAMHLWRQLEP